MKNHRFVRNCLPPILLALLAVFRTTPGAAETTNPFTVHMIGDSTMADKPLRPANPERGWGQLLPIYFNDNVKVVNYAMNGRSSKSFIDEGRWKKAVAALKPGDYVIIQFGHDDKKAGTETLYPGVRQLSDQPAVVHPRSARTPGHAPILHAHRAPEIQ